MNKKLSLSVIVLSLCFTPAEARVKHLSLDMLPDMITAHSALNFNEQAFNKNWLEAKVACHFDEEHDDCSNLAALLRMYVEAVPSQRKLKKYIDTIKPQLKYDDYAYGQVALFKYIYLSDNSLVHLLDEDDVEWIDEYDYFLNDDLTVDDNLKKLHSESGYVIEKTIDSMIAYPSDESMHSDLFERMVEIATGDAYYDAKLLANRYLKKAGYLLEIEDRQYEFESGRGITVTSGGRDPIKSLAFEESPKIWKYYVNRFDKSELVYFLGLVMGYKQTDTNEKIEFVLTKKKYKKLSASKKFILAEKFMKEQTKYAQQILTDAYHLGNHAMKSAIVAKYRDLFPVNNNFWPKLKSKSTAAELKLIERNYLYWQRKMELTD